MKFKGATPHVIGYTQNHLLCNSARSKRPCIVYVGVLNIHFTAPTHGNDAQLKFYGNEYFCQALSYAA